MQSGFWKEWTCTLYLYILYPIRSGQSEGWQVGGAHPHLLWLGPPYCDLSPAWSKTVMPSDSKTMTGEQCFVDKKCDFWSHKLDQNQLLPGLCPGCRWWSVQRFTTLPGWWERGLLSSFPKTPSADLALRVFQATATRALLQRALVLVHTTLTTGYSNGWSNVS